ncbi:MAG: hypothetical protein APF80_03875 [Alphaproteobacteria bacterium BRH_c36]|nr:MAG: hypothetical protein APF80_03875 [Alphaproteobacteria bacterium BRH_c36]
MRATALLAVISASAFTIGTAAAQDLQLPSEVTPQLRAACENDVRRHCSNVKDPTYAKVKSCVRRNFMKLGMRCQLTLASAGFKQ